MKNEPQGELARYAFGFSDKKPGKLFWAIHAAMLAVIVGVTFQPAHSQDFTRVLPNGLTITRVPGQSITVERQGPHRSFSISVGHNAGNPTANAAASAMSVQTGNRPAVAFSRAETSTRVTPGGTDIAHARAVAIGQSTSTSAVTKP